MVAKARTIEVEPGSDLARLIEDPAGLPVDLVKDGVRYRLELLVERTSDDGELGTVTTGVDMGSEEESRRLDQIIGAWADIDVDRLKDELRRAREEGTLPPERRRRLA